MSKLPSTEDMLIDMKWQERIATLEQQVAALTKERDDYRTGYYAQNETRAKFQQELNACEEHLAASQSREAKLREALEVLLPYAKKIEYTVDGLPDPLIKTLAALALPVDDSALMERLKEERERVALWLIKCGHPKPAIDAIRGLA